MTIFDNVFPLGIGTNRFVVQNREDEDGLNQGARVVVTALEAGCSYIDVASTYSKGFAADVCKRAFQMTDAKKDVAVKISYLSDRTEAEALKRVKIEFEKLGIDHASYFLIWNIASYEQFLKIMEKGSIYDGALRAKQLGLVDHICFSTHAPPNEIIRILDSGAFEGVTISFSALNAQIMKPVLDCAERNHVGVIVMNPLGGGVIPQKKDYYKFLCADQEESTIQAALRYVYAHPAVKIVLSGMSSEAEAQENLGAFQKNSQEKDEARIERVDQRFHSIEGFCTGCRYCDGCPEGIDIFQLMQSYNTILFPRAEKLYGRTDPELLDCIGICSRLKNTFGTLPVDTRNPCIGCGRCEARCTAHLPIVQRIEGLYQLFAQACFSKESMLERLRERIGQARKIGFYPGGGYTAFVLSLLSEAFPNTTFDLSVYDSNAALWGKTVSGLAIMAPEDLERVQPQLVIVSNYIYSEEIYNRLHYLEKKGILVKKLHSPDDVPWVF